MLATTFGNGDRKKSRDNGRKIRESFPLNFSANGKLAAGSAQEHEICVVVYSQKT